MKKFEKYAPTTSFAIKINSRGWKYIYNWLSIHKRSPPKLLTTKGVEVEALEVEEGVKLKGVNGAKTFEL